MTFASLGRFEQEAVISRQASSNIFTGFFSDFFTDGSSFFDSFIGSRSKAIGDEHFGFANKFPALEIVEQPADYFSDERRPIHFTFSFKKNPINPATPATKNASVLFRSLGIFTPTAVKTAAIDAQLEGSLKRSIKFFSILFPF